MDRKYMLLAVTFVACLVGCGASDPSGEGSEAEEEGKANASGSDKSSDSSNQGSDSSSQGSDDAPGADSSAPSSTDCANFAGDWKGSVDGKTNKEVIGGTYEVDGPVSLKIGDGANAAISSGALNAVIHGTPLGDIKADQTISGSTSCSKITATATGTVNGKPVSSTVSCTVQDSECVGEWTTIGNGKELAKGTLKLSR